MSTSTHQSPSYFQPIMPSVNRNEHLPVIDQMTLQPTTLNNVEHRQPRLFYAEPLTRLESRPPSNNSNRLLPHPSTSHVATPPQIHDVKSLRIVPTYPANTNDEILSPSKLNIYSKTPNKWRLTQITSNNSEIQKLPRITLIKYKLEGYSNNFTGDDETTFPPPTRDSRRSVSPPPLRRSSLAVPGRRLSLVTGSSTRVLRVVESTPLTPVTVAPDVTQFLFPDEVQAISSSRTLPSIHQQSNMISSYTQTDRKNSYTQTESTKRKRTPPKLLHRFPPKNNHPGGRRLVSIGEARSVKGSLHEGLLAGGRLRRSSSMGPNWRV